MFVCVHAGVSRCVVQLSLTRHSLDSGGVAGTVVLGRSRETLRHHLQGERVKELHNL